MCVCPLVSLSHLADHLNHKYAHNGPAPPPQHTHTHTHARNGLLLLLFGVRRKPRGEIAYVTDHLRDALVSGVFLFFVAFDEDNPPPPGFRNVLRPRPRVRTAVALYSWRLVYWWKNRERAVRAFVRALTHTRKRR